MNKEIINIDGKMIIEDEKGLKKEVECSDNLVEILEEENDIELLENKKYDMYQEISNIEDQISNEKKERIKLKKELIIINIIVPILTIAMFNKFSDASKIILYTFMSSSVTLVISVWLNLASKNEIKKLDDKLSINKKLHEEILNRVNKEKENVKELKKENNYVVKNDNIKTTQINNSDVKEILDFYNYLISNYKELKEKYEIGKLKEELIDFSDEKIDIAFKYFEDGYEINGKQKIKKNQ